MTIGVCGEPNPLVRDGAAQNRRFTTALHPRHARLDERGLAELLLFTGRYAETVQYWDGNDAPDGDFATFVRSDPSYLIAEITAYSTTGFHDAWRWARAAVEDPATVSIGSDRAADLLFNLLFNQVATLNRWLRTASPGLAVYDALERQISGSLRGMLAVALSLHRWLSEDGLLAGASGGGDTHHLASWDWEEVELEGIWFGPDSADALFTDALAAADIGDFAFTGSDDEKRQQAARELDPVYETLSGVLAQLSDDAPDWLRETLTDRNDHAPQMALWLGFARIFRYAQARLNENARRHLDFHYQQVLQLRRRGAVGDRVHLVFTLAKHATAHLLSAGTLLPGGKDGEGNALTYRLTADAALNVATLAEPTDVKTVFFDRDRDHRPFAATVAASSDGEGGDFAEDEEPKWPPFGARQRTDEGLLPDDQRTMAFADVGFAISSPELLLREGERTVTLRLLPTIEQDGDGLAAEQLRIRWTGEKGWEEGDVATLAPSPANLLRPVTEGGVHALSLVFTLGADQPPVLPYDGEVHGPGYETPYPVIEFRMANTAAISTHAADILRSVDLSGATLNVSVTGARALVVQSDAGVLDPAKPFQPFGPAPVKGNSLYVGSDEAFRKRLRSVTLSWRWQSPPASDLSDHYTGYTGSFDNGGFDAPWEVLAGREWSPPGDAKKLFETDAGDTCVRTFDIASLNLPDDRAARWQKAVLKDYRATSDWGFLRLRLNSSDEDASDPFGHLRFPKIYATAAMQYARKPETETPDDPGLPQQPWTPVIEELVLDYTSEVDIDLTGAPGGPDAFLHIYPFGQRAALPGDGSTPLLPRFLHDPDAEDPDSVGELYLGLSGLEPRQNLSFLIQVADGSADPETPQPDVKWWYWRVDGWREFSRLQVLRDDTGGLIRSGLVVLDVPSDAEADPGLLPQGRHWLRVSVGGDPRGVCELLSIRTQAAVAELVAPDEHARHLEVPLPAGTIAGLSTKQAAVKSVEQPFASFGGRSPEGARAFDTRVSERLRHKDRAIAMWDYERLVLENFPSLHKVKCINHSTYVYEDDRFAISQSEFAPGWVTIVVIPDLRNRNMVNPLEPRASLATLDDIKTFVSARMTPWAARRLQVLNPLYERISVDCNVSFVTGADFTLSQAQLSEDLTRFLSPWAFPDAGGADISFGGTLHRSTLLYFVEKRPYVDFVTDFQMILTAPDGGTSSVERAVPSSARTLFASASAHTIGEVEC